MPGAQPRTASDRAASDTPARCTENCRGPAAGAGRAAAPPGPPARGSERPLGRPGPGRTAAAAPARSAPPAMAVLHCALCRRTSFAGRRHLYSAGHRRRLQEALARLQEEVAAARAAAAAGAVRPLEPAEDERRVWCLCCGRGVRRDGRSGGLALPGAALLRHMAGYRGGPGGGGTARGAGGADAVPQARAPAGDAALLAGAAGGGGAAGARAGAGRGVRAAGAGAAAGGGRAPAAGGRAHPGGTADRSPAPVPADQTPKPGPPASPRPPRRWRPRSGRPSSGSGRRCGRRWRSVSRILAWLRGRGRAPHRYQGGVGGSAQHQESCSFFLNRTQLPPESELRTGPDCGARAGPQR